MRKYQEELAQVSTSHRDHLKLFLIIFISQAEAVPLPEEDDDL